MSRQLLRIPKERYSITSLGNLFQCSLPHAVTKCFLMSRQNLFCSSLCLLQSTFCPDAGHHWKEPCSVFIAHSLQVFIHIDEILPSLSCLPWTVPALSASPHRKGVPVTESSWWSSTGLHYRHASIVLGGQELDTKIQVQPHKCWIEGKDHLSWLSGNSWHNAAKNTIILLSSNGRSILCPIFHNVLFLTLCIVIIYNTPLLLAKLSAKPCGDLQKSQWVPNSIYATWCYISDPSKNYFLKTKQDKNKKQQHQQQKQSMFFIQLLFGRY